MRTASPWMAACSLSLLPLMSVWIFFADSLSMPLFTGTGSFSLSPPSLMALPLKSTKRASTPRLLSLAMSTSRTCSIWKSLSPKSVSSRSLALLSTSSIFALDPLKSNRVAISLFAWSTALRISTRLGSSTVSKLGMGKFCHVCCRLRATHRTSRQPA